MRLTELMMAGNGGGPPSALNEDPEILGLTADSRAVAPGYLFAALPGAKLDGRRFIGEAVSHGAAAILAPSGTALDGDAAIVRLVTDDNPRRRLALMAARFFGAQPKTAVAVTGTNGKTSTAWFARELWTALGHKAASIGTLGVIAPDAEPKAGLTTPDPVTLHSELNDLAARGIDHIAIEASSHGIEQARVDGVEFAAAAFTNLTRDHLDYHEGFESYRAAKLRLFDTLLLDSGVAVLNADSDHFEIFERACGRRGIRTITFGHRGGDLRIERLTPTPEGQTLNATVFGAPHEINLPLPGTFQAGNALCALGLVAATSGDAEAATSAMSNLSCVPGRIELAARRANGAPVYVDYAHTPDALETVLKVLRPHTEHRLIVVFGCGGDRDAGKRPIMGEIAAQLADLPIVTDDNPRSEDAAAIRGMIMAGCPGAREVGDRAEAIRAAVAKLESGDVLVVAGKGHESGQIVGDVVRPFDDVSEARQAVAEIDGDAA